jgi:hypothetical protein
MKKFYSLYQSLKRNIKSGYNEQQYWDLALSKWPTMPFSKGRAFQYETCWMIIKDSPKWQSFNEMVEKKETSISPSSTNADTSASIGAKPVEQDGKSTQRPPGNKAAKASKRKPSDELQIDPCGLNAKQARTSQTFAEAAVRRAQVMEDQFAMNLFMMDPQSEISTILQTETTAVP